MVDFAGIAALARVGRSEPGLAVAAVRQLVEEARGAGGALVASLRERALDQLLGVPIGPLSPGQLADLELAASLDWGGVDPLDLGAVLEQALEPEARRAAGAHYTLEEVIEAVVEPTIGRPWAQRLAEATTPDQLRTLHDELARYRVLDPACGSGNFLWVAFRTLWQLEAALVARLGSETRRLGLHQLAGIDREPLAVELCRATLRLGWHQLGQGRPGEPELVVADALLCPWPAAEAIVGNPPFLAKNRMQQALGPATLHRLRERYPRVSGKADYCTYWFRRAHEALPDGGRAGLVGTNTIAQTHSRAGGLDHVVDQGGTIVEAVPSLVWPGEAGVHVSLVSWVKGPHPGPFAIRRREGARWTRELTDRIGPGLAGGVDLGAARPLAANKRPKVCHQGQTHGHPGFLIPAVEARRLIHERPERAQVLRPYLTARDLFGRPDGQATRFVVDFHPRTLEQAARFPVLLAWIREAVLPDRQARADQERQRNALARARSPKARLNRHHQHFLEHWWWLSYPRPALVRALADLPAYLACARYPRRLILVRVEAAVRPSDVLQAFTLADDYSLGVLQSELHRAWLHRRCSTLLDTPRYTASTVFDTFPWPQSPTPEQEHRVARAARALRERRRALQVERELSLRAADALDDPLLREARASVDEAVQDAYGREIDLAGLLELNLELAAREEAGEEVRGPG